jgi:hypothetical protein
MSDWLTSLKTATPQEGYELAILLREKVWPTPSLQRISERNCDQYTKKIQIV